MRRKCKRRALSRDLVVAFAAAAVTMTVAASDYEDDWGPAVGSSMPAIAALDQSGELRDLENLGGERGLLLFMVRSADW